MCLALVIDWTTGAVKSNKNNQTIWRKIRASSPYILLVRVLNSKEMSHRLSSDTTFSPVVWTIKSNYSTISSLNSNVQNEPLGFIKHAQ